MILLRALGLLPLAALLWPHPPAESTMIVVGDIAGYVSPCGCVKPMKGGLRRLATAARQMGSADPATLALYNGALAGPIGRQGEMKAETVAETLALIGVDAVNFSAHDAQFGPGVREAIQRLSGGKLVASGFAPEEGAWQTKVVNSGWTVFGLSAQRDRIASLTGLDPTDPKWAAGQQVALWDGDEASARRLARENPSLKLIVFSRLGQPTAQPLMEGTVRLVSPGEKGKQFLVLKWSGGNLKQTNVVELGPEWEDDGPATAAYHSYLARVTQERLIDRIPRRASDPYIGSKACQSCHTEAYDIWQKSAHGDALATLEKDGHDRDPDCTGCHVVGLDKVSGFVSRAKTPDLANVGCESCHGPGKDHSLDPVERKMVKVDEKSCMPCHNSEHSPGFNFAEYWKKIQH